MALIFSTLFFLCSFSHFYECLFLFGWTTTNKKFLNTLQSFTHVKFRTKVFLFFYTCDVKMILSGDTLNGIRKKFIVEASIRFRELKHEIKKETWMDDGSIFSFRKEKTVITQPQGLFHLQIRLKNRFIQN